MTRNDAQHSTTSGPCSNESLMGQLVGLQVDRERTDEQFKLQMQREFEQFKQQTQRNFEQAQRSREQLQGDFQRLDQKMDILIQEVKRSASRNNPSLRQRHRLENTSRNTSSYDSAWSDRPPALMPYVQFFRKYLRVADFQPQETQNWCSKFNAW